MSIVLYTINCPNCLVLERKLEEKGIPFDVIDDEFIMKEMGFRSAPILQVDNEKPMNFYEAIQWVNAYEG